MTFQLSQTQIEAKARITARRAEKAARLVAEEAAAASLGSGERGGVPLAGDDPEPVGPGSDGPKLDKDAVAGDDGAFDGDDYDAAGDAILREVAAMRARGETLSCQLGVDVGGPSYLDGYGGGGEVSDNFAGGALEESAVLRQAQHERGGGDVFTSERGGDGEPTSERGGGSDSTSDRGAGHDTSSDLTTPSLSQAIDALPGDDTRVPQHQFTRADQVVFLERLSTSGSVRSASRIARVSHQTVYRLRRSCARFRAGWNAALLLARDQAEAALADNALDGREEDVWYHGEVVGKRRRFDARLLLAHLARLDKLAETPDAAFHAGAFDTVLERIAADEDLPEMEPVEVAAGPGTGANSLSSGPCNMRSMSPDGPCDDTGNGEPERSRQYRLLEAMERERPADIPPWRMLGDAEEVEECQMAAFESEDEDWWRYGADYVLFEEDGHGGWRMVPDTVASAEADAVTGVAVESTVGAQEAGASGRIAA